MVILHELHCKIRKQASKEEIVAMYKRDAPLATLTMSCYTKPLCEDYEMTLAEALTAQNVTLPVTQHSPFAPCMSNFLKKNSPWTLNLCMQSVVMAFLTEPIQRLSHTNFAIGDQNHTIEYVQCHSGRGLMSGEKPLWFECDGRVLLNLKPGEH